MIVAHHAPKQYLLYQLSHLHQANSRKWSHMKWLKQKQKDHFSYFFFCESRGSSLTWIIPLGPVRQRSTSPRRTFTWAEDKAQHPVPLFGDKNRQFPPAWRRTRKHNNWPPGSLPSVLLHPVIFFFFFEKSYMFNECM